MSKFEILSICVVGGLLLFIFIMYAYHSSKINPKQKKDEKPKDAKVENKTDAKVDTAPAEPQEEKPVPVGIIRKETIESNNNNVELDVSPLKDGVEENKKVLTKQVDNNQTIQQEIKNLSPQMKSVLLSDILKPRF